MPAALAVAVSMTSFKILRVSFAACRLTPAHRWSHTARKWIQAAKAMSVERSITGLLETALKWSEHTSNEWTYLDHLDHCSVCPVQIQLMLYQHIPYVPSPYWLLHDRIAKILQLPIMLCLALYRFSRRYLDYCVRLRIFYADFASMMRSIGPLFHLSALTGFPFLHTSHMSRIPLIRPFPALMQMVRCYIVCCRAKSSFVARPWPDEAKFCSDSTMEAEEPLCFIVATMEGLLLSVHGLCCLVTGSE